MCKAKLLYTQEVDLKIEDSLKVIKLIDTYGALLTTKQYDMITSYYFDNLSLSEIGDNYNISRQAVRFSISQAIKSLEEYEVKLGIIDKQTSMMSKLQELVSDCNDNVVAEKLNKIIEDIRG